MAEKDDNKSAFAAAMYAAKVAKSLENVRKQYENDKFHDFNIVKEDAIAMREEYRAQREHEQRLRLEKTIALLADEVAELKKSGYIGRAKKKEFEIARLRREGVAEDPFDTDEVTKNFTKTLDEIIEDFGQATRDEMKVSINRMSMLIESIEQSNAVEKDFLLEQYKQTQEAMQKEFRKRANIAVAATQKLSELSEQYLDISSLYAGFVDNNPFMMTLFRIGSDFIRRNREMKKAQREAMIRDKKNQMFAEKKNIENKIREELERKRQEELFAIQQETLEKQKKITTVEEKIVKAKQDKEEPTVVESVDGFDASDFFSGIQSDDDDEPLFERAEQNQLNVSDYVVSGDEPISIDALSELFGSVDEDGDPVRLDDAKDVLFERYDGESDPVSIQDDEPVNVRVAEDTPEQKAQSMFIRQDVDERIRLERENMEETKVFNERVLEKLTDIERAILKNGESMTDSLKESGGLLESLGLGSVLEFFKKTLLRGAALLAPAVAALSGLLGKIGLGGLGDKLSGSFDDMLDRNGVKKKPTKSGKPGKISRAPNAGGKAGRLAKIGDFMKSGVGKVGRGAMSLLGRGATMLAGSTTAAVAGAGAAGYGVGTLINDHVLSDDQKESIGDFIGSKIDTLLSWFGNDDAQRRLELMERMKVQNGTTLGVNPKSEVKPNIIPSAKSADPKFESKLDNIEVPMSERTKTNLTQIEEKVTVIKMVQADNAKKPVVVQQPPKVTKQRVVKSGSDTTPINPGRSARNPDSSIQRITDRFVSFGFT